MRTAAFSGFIYRQFVNVRSLKRKLPFLILRFPLKGFLEDFQDVKLTWETEALKKWETFQSKNEKADLLLGGET